MQKIKKMLFCLLLLPSLAFAWNSNGHRIIAQIAYDNLNSAAKSRIDSLTHATDPHYNARSRFLFAAVWPDKIKNDGVLAFNDWHFINYGFSTDGTKIAPLQTENVVWAIGQSEHTLLSPNADRDEKAVALSFLIHFVGDIHQPLHCTVRYSSQFPLGDKNGILFPIHAANVNNLHDYWDEGLGLFGNVANSSMTDKKISKLADEIQQTYPKKFFGAKIYDVNAKYWAEQSFKIARNFAYDLPENSKPSAQYNKKGRSIVKQQIALAGYRLAHLLNKLFS